jgi:hypothetical protein
MNSIVLIGLLSGLGTVMSFCCIWLVYPNHRQFSDLLIDCLKIELDFGPDAVQKRQNSGGNTTFYLNRHLLSQASGCSHHRHHNHFPKVAGIDSFVTAFSRPLADL